MLAPLTGRAHVVGLTGAPGRRQVDDDVGTGHGATARSGRRVGVLAVDPSSPFTGGALLGDRVRMQEHATDPGVFIRSMATRGHLGGLAAAAPQAVRVLDAAGCDVVLIETVGVGQSEVEVAGLADTTVVLLAPGMGDADPGGQGRHPGDRRRVLREQGRPRRGRRHRARAAHDAGDRAERRGRGRAGVASTHPQDGGLPRRGHRRAAAARSTSTGPTSSSTTSWRRRRRRARPRRDRGPRRRRGAGEPVQRRRGPPLDRLAADVVSGATDPYTAAASLLP